MVNIEPLKPIFTAHLLEKIERLLIELLRSLGPAEWERPTIVPGWQVRHVAAHLLDTQLRKMSMVRDGWASPGGAPKPDESLSSFIDRLNNDGVTVYSRLSPRVLISLMEIASADSVEFHTSLDPFEKARFSVSWAGETGSENWFDTARELTERWHHQQQVRLATARPGIMTPELYHPVLDTFMRALPWHYRNIDTAPGSAVTFAITGDCGGKWNLYREETEWRLIETPAGKIIAETTIPQEIAWRIFTKGIGPDEASVHVAVAGDENAGSHILSMLSIVA